MAYYCFRNMGPYSFSSGGGAAFFYDWKENMKATGGTKSYSVVQSGDGIAAYNASGDVITSGGSGANGLNNPNAWFVMEDPDSNRQILIWRASNQNTFGMRYSRGKLFTGGGAATLPTATDQKFFLNNRAETLYITNDNCYAHMVVEGDTPDGDVYPFWFALRTNPGGNHDFLMFVDCVVDALSPAADGDKMMICATYDALNANSGAYLGNLSASCRISSYMRYGEANEEWGGTGICQYTTALPGGGFTNPENGSYPVLPTFYFRNSQATNGIKGQARMARWEPGNFSYGDIVQSGSLYYLVLGDIMLPGWPDTTGPLV